VLTHNTAAGANYEAINTFIAAAGGDGGQGGNSYTAPGTAGPPGDSANVVDL